MGIRHAQRRGGPDVPGQRPPPGPRRRCGGQSNARQGREGRRRQSNPPGLRGESPWWGGCRSTDTGLGAWGSPRWRSGPPGKGLFRVPARLPRCFGGQGLFSRHSGSRSHSPTGWKRGGGGGEGGKGRPSGHFVPESPKNGISARCQRKGCGLCWETPPSRLSLERFDTRATQQEKEAVGSRWTARRSVSV